MSRSLCVLGWLSASLSLFALAVLISLAPECLGMRGGERREGGRG